LYDLLYRDMILIVSASQLTGWPNNFQDHTDQKSRPFSGNSQFQNIYRPGIFVLFFQDFAGPMGNLETPCTKFYTVHLRQHTF